ncbi:DMT family transporter [Leeia sp. TBRC 13508]|uniref:DMT family transporter n=1 Tax=Leeia speluncae TaxID=2884804 RepID=A0ABS8D268_9NEIS|nr:DMT family transporter [Leeia speluncae]MCB6182081.1 DMT family transporter [Leeia speluncae]
MNIILLVIASLCFALSDAYAKQLGQHYDALQLVWMRYAIPFLILPCLLLRSGFKKSFGSSNYRMQIMRGFAILASAILFIMSLKRMNIGDATAIAFLSPVLIVILAFVFYREKVTWLAWIGVVISFGGALVISPPSFAGGNIAMLFPASSALCWALAVLFTRRLGGVDSSTITLNWTFLIGFIISTAILIGNPITISKIGAQEILMGGLSTIGQFLIILSYSIGNVSRLAPLSYIQMFWSVVAAWIFFTEMPDKSFWIGSAFILAGSYLCLRQPKNIAPAHQGNVG